MISIRDYLVTNTRGNNNGAHTETGESTKNNIMKTSKKYITGETKKWRKWQRKANKHIYKQQQHLQQRLHRKVTAQGPKKKKQNRQDFANTSKVVSMPSNIKKNICSSFAGGQKG